MTSFLPSTTTTTPTPKRTIIAAFNKPLHTSGISIVSKPNVTCQATKDDELQDPYIIGRRKALIVLGGSYGTVLGKTAPPSRAELICPPNDDLLPGVCMHTTELSLTSMVDFPRVLNSVIGINIARPPLKLRRKKKPKEEVLVVDVKLLPTDAPIVKFDVYINNHLRPYQRSPLVKAEYVGSFSSSPLRHDENGGCRTMETSLKLGLDRIIVALGAHDDEILEVSLVPRSGQDGIVIRDVRIECISK